MQPKCVYLPSNFVIAGGGTGGHIYPGIALAREIEQRFTEWKVIFVGTEKGLEAKIVPREGFQFKTLDVAGLKGTGLLQKLKTGLKLPFSIYQAIRLLKELNPVGVLGTGGYASGPVVYAAYLMRIPTVILEPNIYPGLANRILGRSVGKIAICFAETEKFFPKGKTVLTGNPVRREIVEAGKTALPEIGPFTPSIPLETAKPDVSKMTILIFGGSQGAHTINMAVVETLPYLIPWKDSIHLIHQTGEADFEQVTKGYRQARFSGEIQKYIDSIPQVYARSHLVVCRAGATTVAELTACGKPAILIPYPYAIYNHQELNARSLAKAGAAEMILNRDLSGKVLAEHILTFIKNPDRLNEMHNQSKMLGKADATERLLNEILQVIELKEEKL
jgi:UDP-N-acetylglucosamine--N-acetylmuramyl-(pentapeptide) pyrophosphoryl-undecaprenol N-acetylglucosamine transferase